MAQRRVMGTIVGIVVLIAGAIIALKLLVPMIEAGFAFFPTAGEDVTPSDFGARYEPLTIPTADGEQLHAWKLSPDAPRAHIVYFHGNGGNLSNWAPILVALSQRGYSVLAVDYRGYGRSTGRPNERGLYRDVDAVVERAWRDADRRAATIYWGRSLGAVMAAYAASVRPGDGVVLESGFPDARAVTRTSPVLAILAPFSTYRFPAAEFLRAVTSPVLVMHGDRDRVIPFALGRALFDRLAGPKQFVTIRGGDHNDLTPPDPAAYWSAVEAFVDRVRKPLG